MSGILEYSSTPASNGTVNGIGITGSSSLTLGDDAIRQIMADTASAVTRHVTKAAGTYSAAKGDYNQLWRATGAVTINLTAAATLTDGWCLWVKADGGDVLIDPSSSEQINGANTLTVYKGSSALVICTGTAFFALVADTVDAVRDDRLFIVDPADATKKVRIDVGNVATATTRVLTMPNADVAISTFAATMLDDATGANVWTTLGAASSQAGTGYFKLPDGAIWQYGTSVVITDGSGNYVITLPIAFPNAIFTDVVCNGNAAGGSIFPLSFTSASLSVISGAIRNTLTGATVPSTQVRINWVAVGR